MTTRQPDPRRTDRYEAPEYLAHYRQRQTTEPVTEAHGGASADDGTPLYLKRFRSRGAGGTTATHAEPGVEQNPVIHAGEETFTHDYAQATREKEIVAPPELREPERVVAEIRIIRHGITQGYSTDAGLTPMGGWQSHQRGHSLSKSIKEGQRVRIVCAQTNRATQTAHQIHRGVLDGLEQWQHKADVSEPEPIPELRNFAVWTPEGMRDITSAFRIYHAQMERLERMAVGDRPRWLVEIDRFYRTQFGGSDPIAMWLTIPMMYFEPPQAAVRRFWRGFHRLIAEEDEGTRIIAATHSGPIRAFATWAHGYDPGEPYNTEEVVVKVRSGGQSATVAYRNRVTEVNIPAADEFPNWDDL
jgi:broad specificity phosphatase PhoE